jgi:hypothetical protein
MVAQETDVVAERLPAATSPLEETDANVPAPEDETLVKPDSARFRPGQRTQSGQLSSSQRFER